MGKKEKVKEIPKYQNLLNDLEKALLSRTGPGDRSHVEVQMRITEEAESLNKKEKNQFIQHVVHRYVSMYEENYLLKQKYENKEILDLTFEEKKEKKRYC